ncbi:hypothetical protein AMTR_s00049p00164180 [Amborella trichopoda]|uniref:Uncharacterized protein n=1 Tax=Amborella trichopoda TaxID=13333 RepID=W1Q043_AMBTC|nr:hypothetical protein AMTR_s00049p00164180 [Amborella trichopoda]
MSAGAAAPTLMRPSSSLTIMMLQTHRQNKATDTANMDAATWITATARAAAPTLMRPSSSKNPKIISPPLLNKSGGLPIYV